MEELIIFALLVIGVLVLALPISAIVTARRANRQVSQMGRDIGFLREQQARSIEREARLIQRIEVLETVNKMPRPHEEPAVMETQANYAPPPSQPERECVVRPLASIPAPAAPQSPAPVSTAPAPQPAPPPIPHAKPRPAPAPSINLEQFMGAKLFAWVGGLALFLGIIFFVKLSI